MRPLKENGVQRGILWTPTKLPHDITTAGQQWVMIFETWRLDGAKLERMIGASQYYQRRCSDIPDLLAVTVTDEVLFSGPIPSLEQFCTELNSRFEARKVIIGDEVAFNGCVMRQHAPEDITMSMKSFAEKVIFIEVSRKRRKDQDRRATEREVKLYRRLASELMWFISGTLPQATLAASLLQQELPSPTVRDMCMATSILKEVKSLQSLATFCKVIEHQNSVVLIYSDAAFNIFKSHCYGQFEVLPGALFAIIDSEDKWFPHSYGLAQNSSAYATHPMV